MSLPLNRCLAVLLLGAMLAGCQNLPVLQKPSMTAAESFARGLDEYLATGDLQLLQRLPQDYPDSAWAPRAESVARLAGQQQQCAAGAERIAGEKAGGKQQQALHKDQELAGCHNEMTALKQNNQELEETIARLKKLLIDMESRSN